MTQVNVLYPNSGGRFDFDYYVGKHIPMVKRLGDRSTLRDVRVTRVESGVGPGSRQEYVCIASMIFDSPDSVQKFLAAHGAEIFADVPNYTDLQPVIQMGEVLV